MAKFDSLLYYWLNGGNHTRRTSTLMPQRLFLRFPLFRILCLTELALPHYAVVSVNTIGRGQQECVSPPSFVCAFLILLRVYDDDSPW